MTYVKPPRRYIARPRKPAGSLAGWVEDLEQDFGIGSPESQCLAAANQTMAPFDAKIDDLARNWKPTGFYTSADIRGLINQTLALVREAQAAVNAAAAEPNASQDSVMRATTDLGRKGQDSLDYLKAASDADAQGIRVINAPGFKRWVTDTMGAASSAMVTAAVIGCITPWWVGALAAFQSAFDLLIEILRDFVGAVAAVGERVLKAADAVLSMVQYILLGAAGLAAYYIWTRADEVKAHFLPKSRS
ncbi:MAG TPA: hypothetical protein VK571_09870 [Gemmatimonadaceae bacterium]|nr:hypothetical protein [Gemmatimonadaceae bacterium]HMG58027.1 hypothetical protein [Kofleriaceae bacterium]